MEPAQPTQNSVLAKHEIIGLLLLGSIGSFPGIPTIATVLRYGIRSGLILGFLFLLSSTALTVGYFFTLLGIEPHWGPGIGWFLAFYVLMVGIQLVAYLVVVIVSIAVMFLTRKNNPERFGQKPTLTLGAVALRVGIFLIPQILFHLWGLLSTQFSWMS